MEGLTGLLGQLFTSANLPKILSGGVLGAGEIGNILAERKRNQYQNTVMNLATNPGALSRLALSNEKPLDNALVQGVTNQVQGQLAERGLSQAPGIFASTESQALAPFVQQNQQIAMDAILRALGLPASTFGNPQDMSGAMKLFMDALNKPNASGTPPFTPTGGSFPQPAPTNPFPSGVIPDTTQPTFDPSIFTVGLPTSG